MECAIEVFSRRGIGRAGHAEIAEQAKVSVATVFNYFNTREELVDEVLAGSNVSCIRCWNMPTPARARSATAFAAT